MMRRGLRVILIGLLVVLTGCTAGFPTEGPVLRASDSRATERPPGIDVAAQPPAEDASAEAILEGFFSASESPTDGYSVARQYLTPEAAASWRPETGVTIYDATGQSRVVTADGAAVLRAPVVGRVGADHVFTAVHERDFAHNFHMTQVDGQWRIANPGEGVLMSIQRFQRAFQQVPVYFLDLAGERMVAQQVFLRPDDVQPEGLVRALLNGPGPWLRLAVLSALPAEVMTSGTVIDPGGIARVSLSSEIEALSAEQRSQAAAQLLYTLGYFEDVVALQITVNGRPLALNGTDADGVLHASAITHLSGARAPAPRTLYGISSDVVVQVPEDPGAALVPVAGPLGSGLVDPPGQLAVSWQGDQFGLVNVERNALYLASAGLGIPNHVYSGTQLAKPQFDASGQLWTIDSTDGGPVVVQIGERGQQTLLPLSELAAAQVVAFRISPDMTRMAVIAQFGEVRRLGLLRLRAPDHLIIDGWRELPVNTSRGLVTELLDVVFTSPERLMVLGATDRDPQLVVYSLDIDAAQVTSQGPLNDVDAVGLTAMPTGATNAVALVTAANRGLRYEAQYRWPLLTEQVTDLAYPS